MNEQTPSFHERTAGAGGGLGGLFDDNGDGDLVMVACGPYGEQLPVANMTVGEVRTRFRDRFDIDPRSQAVLGGHDVGDDTRLQPGQVLMFVRRAGEKGRSVQSLCEQYAIAPSSSSSISDGVSRTRTRTRTRTNSLERSSTF